MSLEQKLNLIRAKHLQRRYHMDDDGKWVTTENDNRIHINEEGEIDKGNPDVLNAIKKGQARSKRLSDLPRGDIFWSRGYRYKKTGDDEYTNLETGETTNSRGIKDFKDNVFTVADLQKRREENYGLSGGTWQSVRREVPANVYTTPNGMEIVMPVGMNKSKQRVTLEKLVEEYNNIPAEIQKLGQKKIELQDVYNPRDSYWKQHYKGFNHSFATGGELITFWRYDYDVDNEFLEKSLIHEMAHWIDLGGSYSDKDGNTKKDHDRFCYSSAWEDAMEQDERHSGNASPTLYGRNSNAEDFADSVATYILETDRMERDFPARSDLIKKIIRGEIKIEG